MDVNGKKISVIGAGKSGLAVAELLRNKGANVLLSEFGHIHESGRLRMQQIQVPFEEQGHSEKVYDADFGVISPGIPPSAPVVQLMQAKKIPLYSEIDIACRFCQARIIGITGTDGKTTTSTIVHRICEEDGRRHGYRSFSVGNIGVPFSSMVLDMRYGDVAVVELSSYQLERSPSFRPDVSVITNITPDHLARYGGDIYNYAAAKFRIYANQGKSDTLVYNADDPLLSAHFTSGAVCFPFRLFPFSMETGTREENDGGSVVLDGERIIVRTAQGDELLMDTSELLKKSFRGRHNIANVLAAVAAVKALNIDNQSVVDAVRDFQGVEHRQEFVATINGVDWVNDSKATNLNAMRQALESLSSTAVLIAGGRDKGNDYQCIAELVKQKVSLLIAIGESQEKIVSCFDGIVPLKRARSLEEAVSIASNAGSFGQTVLFSPGCASFDMFENFEERGKHFKQCVHQLPS